jgi:hypothetical protein
MPITHDRAKVHEWRVEGDHLRGLDPHLRERQLRDVLTGHESVRARRLGEDGAVRHEWRLGRRLDVQRRVLEGRLRDGAVQ